MRDTIAWYLIELRRRLKSVEPQQRVEDFLLETRTHLQESIEDMTARGISEESATKAAITDFGHPSLVAQAFRGRITISPGLYWVLVGVIVLLAIPVIVQVVSSSTDDAIGGFNVSAFDFGLATTFILTGIVALSLASRKWCSLLVAIAGLAITASVGFWYMNNTQAYAMQTGSSRFVMLSDQKALDQVLFRTKWLDEYEATVPKLAAAIKDTSTGADHRLAVMIYQQQNGSYSSLEGNAYVGYMSYYETPNPVPSNGYYISRSRSRFIAIEEANTRVRYVGTTQDRDQALKSWKEFGPRYLASLDEQRSRLIRERSAFQEPSKVEQGAVLSRLFYAPMAIVGMFSLLGLLLNGMAIGALNLITSTKRRGWRRQLN